MNTKYNEFSKSADAIITNSLNRSKTIALAIAVAVSNLSSIPSTQVDSAVNYFNLQILPEIRGHVSGFNENVIFDCNACVEYARIFWMLRYTAAHPISRPIYSLDFNFFDSVCGVGTFVPPEMLAFLNENKNQILVLSTVAATTIYELGNKNA